MAKSQKINLIEELTTHKCDFQIWPIHPVQPNPDARPRKEPTVKSPPPCIQIDPQSHAVYNPSVKVPFDLYLLPKPIVGTDPRECFKTEKTSKYGGAKEDVFLTTILSPALDLYEIEDQKSLEKILKYSYTGMHKILMEEAARNISKTPNPPKRVVPEGNNIRFKSDIYPPLPPGWIAAAKHWDCLQSRYLGDPFKTFWTRKGSDVECSCCCNPIPDMLPKEMKEEISSLICEDKLRLPYDITKTGYGGYRQICAKGVPLKKS